ncbi:glycine/D-amino acid oxidase-like deaminating enzyme/nitrite reductase/ring-hydroxylating ferredoxin subunit [Dyadobacter sp. BE34]|uniref:Glycine/D-amino acid oxidase-like deaminating enzyme/nitrite reductase/ring-hydroxylating ferredoxin subunit n=1 Tax=Dyadobacter fermentans TaxID=94254 RepID=A0ABU1QUI1_9BACT|nr:MULTISPECIES: FAD-dependent oxidoreductase [Dyadobacter]MDR6804801.1 glycine/D-amino acid oxidase-like deaminating enzyme/nitrite reductase/ring-hydroxylating ferredoxin subunit [Dyadobacter fermentans]MDR7043440.1 glycine/D-amino acid oxidase-like deaminating enzyme/nitrite reductase/ring-hydroxylating ferredoxin subunit [Dyadobacter sp. BE242]MDR7197752.1 glycine/D-amino acid oxidase-like deaminating enzyme/nitrite reductase/ring-hydroxylating ferredoxin subunit [Dyadobacter sp. BE34]MDR72
MAKTEHTSKTDVLPDAHEWERDGQNASLWNKDITLKNEETALPETEVYDVIVVGAGITGLTTALLLQQAGNRCALVDAHHAGFGTTGGTTAHINTFADTTYAEVEQAFGTDAAPLFAESIRDAVELIRHFVETYQIDCDLEWRQGYVYAETEEEVKQLDDLYESALRAGVGVAPADDVPTPVPYLKAVVFDGQAQFHPLKYIRGLLNEFRKSGGTVVENACIREVETADGHYTAISDQHRIHAKRVVYATHIPPGGINVLHFRNAPYRSYVIAATLADGAYPDALVYDSQEPYHYFRTHTIDGQRYLVAGGHDHKTGHNDPERAFADLIAYTSKYYNVEQVAYRWSAQYYVPADGLPYIGHLPGASEGIYAATGYNGNGMILGTAAALVISDLITTGDSKYKALFDPARVKPVAGFAEVVKENADVVKRFIGDRFGIAQIDSLADVSADDGRIIELDGEKLAVYRDPAGEVHVLDPVCTHAKCIVQWNSAEKSWDCPCHGARYDCFGHVLTGPARADLDQML